MDKRVDILNQIRSNFDVVIKLLAEYKENNQQVKVEGQAGVDGQELPIEPEVIIRESDLDRLKKDNYKLRAHCELLETGNNADVTRRIDDVVDQAHQLEVLNQKISDFKYREEKIIETLGKKARDLRTDFYMLTGYKVYACKDLVYKVMSKFAPGFEDKLVFQLSPQGKIKLIEDNYSRKFWRYIDQYLSNGADNFPPFLASITLELFNKSNVQHETAISPTLTTNENPTNAPVSKPSDNRFESMLPPPSPPAIISDENDINITRLNVDDMELTVVGK